MQDNAEVIASPKSKVSITEAARLAGVDRTTINRRARNGEISKLPQSEGGGIEMSELLRVYPDIRMDDTPPPSYDRAKTGEEKRAALKEQVSQSATRPSSWAESATRDLTEMNLALTRQLIEKDKTIQELTASASHDREVLIRQFDNMATRFLPPPEEQPKRKRWWRRR